MKESTRRRGDYMNVVKIMMSWRWKRMKSRKMRNSLKKEKTKKRTSPIKKEGERRNPTKT